MSELVLGPLLRYVGETEATVWVETDVSCEVEVLGHTQETFEVEDHHYALVCVDGLEPGGTYEYEVSLAGERRWPDPESEFPPSVIRTLDRERPIELAFGSCRVALPHESPYNLSKDEDERGFEYDALHAKALEMLEHPREQWPQVLLMLGDQVYVDEGAPRTREYIRATRGTGEEPYDDVINFEEYTQLYRESWGEPVIRWLLSTVSVSMVTDDHDMSDDWNISRAWVDEMRRKPWWKERIVGGVTSYWVYQHLGNLSPRDLEENDEYQAVCRQDDAGPILREFAARADQEVAGIRWSYCRDLGNTRLIVMDSRSGRVLEEDRRSIFDDDERDWIVDHAGGEFDHLLIGTSVPFLLAQGAHHLEAWNEAVTDGVWGRLAARLGEKMRRALDFDHWAAFGMSFRRLAALLEEVGSGKRGPAPASIVVLSGDVHHAYLAEVEFPNDREVTSAVYQAVCSPFRNPLDARERRAIKANFTRPAARVARALARAAGVRPPQIEWRFCEGPYFDNQIGTLSLEGRRATLRLEKTVRDDANREGRPRLEQVFERQLA